MPRERMFIHEVDGNIPEDYLKWKNKEDEYGYDVRPTTWYPRGVFVFNPPFVVGGNEIKEATLLDDGAFGELAISVRMGADVFLCKLSSGEDDNDYWQVHPALTSSVEEPCIWQGFLYYCLHQTGWDY